MRFYVFIRTVAIWVVVGLFVALCVATFALDLTPGQVTFGAFCLMVVTVLLDLLFVRPTRR